MIRIVANIISMPLQLGKDDFEDFFIAGGDLPRLDQLEVFCQSQIALVLPTQLTRGSDLLRKSF